MDDAPPRPDPAWRRWLLPRPADDSLNRRRRWTIWLLTVPLTLAWAVLANYGLDVATWRPGPQRWTGPWHTTPILLNILVVWLVVVLVLAVTGRLWLTLGLTGLVVVGLGSANATKLRLRNDPIYPGDTTFLQQPGFLVEMVGRQVLVLAAVGGIVVVLGAWILGHQMNRWFPNVTHGLTRRGRIGLWSLRAVTALVCLGLLVSAAQFNQPGNNWRAAYEDTGVRWRPWVQRVNYERNGFVAGLLYTTHVEAMKEPADYSEATLDAIAARYSALAAAQNRTRTGNLERTNIVTVLSESFSDPTWLSSVRWPTTPIPKTTAVMAQTTSGRLLTPGYGSGTANTEFELLTGQSMSQFAPQLQIAYDGLASKYPTYPSAVGWFKERGHIPIALHPFSLRMYKRPAVFKAFGFEKILDKNAMKDPYKVDGSKYVSDAAAFDQVLAEIRAQDDPLFMHLITMQNHMPYRGQYDDPIAPTDGLSGGNRRTAGQYARGLQLSDEALARFLDQLRSEPEPTVVVLYGDHLPPEVYPAGLVRREGQRLTHETPWLIWSNQEPLPHLDLPTTSPTQLLPLMFRATNTPAPPYYALLEALYAQLPAMDAGMYIDAANQTTRLSDLTPAQQQVLDDYRMVQYDLSLGKRYSEDVMFGDPPVD